MIRTAVIALALFGSTAAMACPGADAAEFAEAKAAVERAEGTHVQFAITGMSCASCSAKVTAELEKVEGVVASAVDYQTGRAEVAFDATRTNADAVLAAIRKAGFEAQRAES